MTLSHARSILILRDVASLRARVAAWRAAGEAIALVPTMGALHAGHVSLFAAAKQRAHRVVASIFVNPTQFAPNEDFAAYPRTFEADVEKCADAFGDCVYAPSVEAMYADGFATLLTVGGPAVVGLEDRFRPTHFSGVATVVAKLLNQCRPDIAIFGEKDYQQLKVIAQFVRDLDFDAQIIGAPTLRDADGLALSSRNVYLTPAERALAPRLYEALKTCADEINSGRRLGEALEEAGAKVAKAGFKTDYLEARHAETLTPIVSSAEGPIRLLAAAKLGQTRLIDNLGV
jgi:pantoate--beta-alanine ligase